MKLDAAAYHEIINLTSNVAVSPAETETWKKCLLVTADEKIKLQTRSSWLNCALRDDEAVYWVSIGHYEAVVVGMAIDDIGSIEGTHAFI